MKVKWIEFENLKTNLKIERIYFYEDITLLVGLSGVGKTQILNAVEYSFNLAVDKDVLLQPFRVSMGMTIDKDNYEWSYEINNLNQKELLLKEEEYGFVFEQLKCNEECLFKREKENITVLGYDKVPQPKKDESLLLQYSEDKKFERLISEIRKLYLIEIELAIRGGIRSENFSILKSKVEDILQKRKHIEFKAFSHLPVPLKLYIAKNYYYDDLYIKIFDAVKELFIEIEDIDIIEDTVREMYLVSIQVYGKRLLQNDISNGMLKTIYYILELLTMPENSLVLIDEFENGLGVNCIDSLSEVMLSERTDLQFIMTSHHPKIINSVEQNKWKIIDREGSIIKNKDSEAYGIGNSRHDAYFNLINRWEYEGKI